MKFTALALAAILTFLPTLGMTDTVKCIARGSNFTIQDDHEWVNAALGLYAQYLKFLKQEGHVGNYISIFCVDDLMNEILTGRLIYDKKLDVVTFERSQ